LAFNRQIQACHYEVYYQEIYLTKKAIVYLPCAALVALALDQDVIAPEKDRLP